MDTENKLIKSKLIPCTYGLTPCPNLPFSVEWVLKEGSVEKDGFHTYIGIITDLNTKENVPHTTI